MKNYSLIALLSVSLVLGVGLWAGRATVYGAPPVQPPAQSPATGEVDFLQVLRELQPRMIMEVQQDRINAYLRAHPGQFDLPPGFEDPQVALGGGLVEVSARTKVLLIATRVRVLLIPRLDRGRLRFKVHKVSAGPLPLPFGFQRSVGDTLAGVVNEFLEQNDLQVEGVELDRGLVRVTATVGSRTMTVRP